MRFRYEALQSDGRLVIGQIEAVSARSAHRDLLRRGVQPTEITAASATARAGPARRKVRRRAHLYLLNELLALVHCSVPVAVAVTALHARRHPPALTASP